MLTIDTRIGSNPLKLKKIDCLLGNYSKVLTEFSKMRTLEDAYDLAKELSYDNHVWFALSDGELLLKFIIEEDVDGSGFYANIYYYCDGASFEIIK